MKTEFIKKAELKKNWVLIDAENAVLGRLAVISANILRGKNKVNYSPNSDCGDYLIIINSDKIKFTGKKLKDKIYNRHTGYPGGLKSTNPKRWNCNFVVLRDFLISLTTSYCGLFFCIQLVYCVVFNP